MPSSSNYKRDYTQEYATAKKRKEQGTGSNSTNAKQHRAKRALEKKTGKRTTTTSHAGHVKSIKSGGGNGAGNVKRESASKNLSKGGKSGSKAGKAAGARKGHRSRGK